jgi:K+-transporting ATPase ATPase A chain
MASQVAIKMLGTNGGGYANANATHPFENPTPFSNFLQMLSIFSIGSGLTYYLGRMVKNQKHGWAVWSAMMILFLAGESGLSRACCGEPSRRRQTRSVSR